MLIIFSGLPGAGKSTIARLLAKRLDAIWLRIDTIEQPIMAAYGDDIADVGYRVAYGVAEDNLCSGNVVIADCVNDVAISRDAWRAVADRAGTPALELEVLCSDQGEHRRRVEERVSDIPGPRLPSWEDIRERRSEPWSRDRLVVDTAGCEVEDCLAQVLAALNQEKGDAS
jgi:predicted kinase